MPDLGAGSETPNTITAIRLQRGLWNGSLGASSAQVRSTGDAPRSLATAWLHAALACTALLEAVLRKTTPPTGSRVLGTLQWTSGPYRLGSSACATVPPNGIVTWQPGQIC